MFTSSSGYNLSSDSVFFFHVHIDIDKDADCLESNNDSLNDLGYFFQPCFFLESLVL